MERKPEDEQKKAERSELENGGADGRRRELKRSRGTEEMEPGQVRETLREILMEIPGFQRWKNEGSH